MSDHESDSAIPADADAEDFADAAEAPAGPGNAQQGYLDHFVDWPGELITELATISTLSSTEYELSSPQDRLSLSFKPRILSMIDFVPCYDQEEGTSSYTETTAQKLINKKRETLQTTLDEIRADTEVFSTDTDNRVSRIKRPFQSSVEALGLAFFAPFDWMGDSGEEFSIIYDADKNFDSKMYEAYAELYNKYEFIRSTRSEATQHLEKYSEISGTTDDGFVTISSNDNAYRQWMYLNSTFGLEDKDEIKEILQNILNAPLNTEVHPINVIRDSFLILVYNFCDHSRFFNEPGFNEFFIPIKNLRGRHINGTVYDVASMNLANFEPYAAIYNGNFSDDWTTKLAAMLFTLSERSTILSMGDGSFDTDLISAITNVKDIINEGSGTRSTVLEKYNLLTTEGLRDAIMTISTYSTDSKTNSELNNLTDFYTDVIDSINSVIEKIDTGRTIKSCTKNIGDFFNNLNNIKIDFVDDWHEELGEDTETGDGIIDNDLAMADGDSLLIDKVIQNTYDGSTSEFWKMKNEILLPDIGELVGDDWVGAGDGYTDTEKQYIGDEYHSEMSFQFDGALHNRLIARRLMRHFCFPGVEEEDYPTFDQEFMFLVCAISDILANKLSFAYMPTTIVDAKNTYNYKIFQPIFETFINEKFQLYRARNALNSVVNKLENINDGLDDFIRDYLVDPTPENATTSNDADKHFYTKRAINTKIKVWYESIQNYNDTETERLILEKYNLNEDFKNKGLEMFMKETEHIMNDREKRERTKKILSIGVPAGLIDELERNGVYDEAGNPYIEIKVHKRNFLDDSIPYVPKSFRFRLNEETVFNNFKTYIPTTDFGTSEDDYIQISTRVFDSYYTSYSEFIQNNTSVLNLDSSTYSDAPWKVTIDSLSGLSTTTGKGLWAKRSLDSKLYQYYIQSLYGIEMSPESFLEEKDLLSVEDYSSYVGSLEKPDLFVNILKQKSVMFNSSKTFYETTKKQLFDKIFHVLIDTEDFDLTDGGLDYLADPLNNLDVKYDDFYVTFDIYNPIEDPTEDIGGDAYIDTEAADYHDDESEKPITVTHAPWISHETPNDEGEGGGPTEPVDPDDLDDPESPGEEADPGPVDDGDEEDPDIPSDIPAPDTEAGP